jgi:hypothetical protein
VTPEEDDEPNDQDATPLVENDDPDDYLFPEEKTDGQ